LHNPVHVLSVAVAFGVGFIVLTLLVNARNKWVAGHRAEAMFDSTGLAGLVFYLGAVAGRGQHWPAADCRSGATAWMLALVGITGGGRVQMGRSQSRIWASASW
jgi:V/A-type H+-transporting ATPase subunit I